MEGKKKGTRIHSNSNHGWTIMVVMRGQTPWRRHVEKKVAKRVEEEIAITLDETSRWQNIMIMSGNNYTLISLVYVYEWFEYQRCQ